MHVLTRPESTGFFLADNQAMSIQLGAFTKSISMLVLERISLPTALSHFFGWILRIHHETGQSSKQASPCRGKTGPARKQGATERPDQIAQAEGLPASCHFLAGTILCAGFGPLLFRCGGQTKLLNWHIAPLVIRMGFGGLWCLHATACHKVQESFCQNQIKGIDLMNSHALDCFNLLTQANFLNQACSTIASTTQFK